MLKHRLLMSAFLIPLTVGLFVWDHHLGESAPILLLLVMAIAARCTWELVTLARTAGFQPNLALTLVASWSLLVLVWGPHLAGASWSSGPLGDLFGMFGVVAVVLVVNAVFRFPLDQPASQHVSQSNVGREIATLSLELFGVVYVGAFLATTSQLRWSGKSSGYFALGALVVAAKTGDIGAYTVGRLIGGPKMTPKLSPGKTWSGGVGHLVASGICSVGWLCWLGPMISSQWQPWSVVPATIFGVVVGFAGLIGDLAESLIKRDVGVKDAPAFLPGFGGLLDLMDSILLAGPVAYGMWHLLN